MLSISRWYILIIDHLNMYNYLLPWYRGIDTLFFLRIDNLSISISHLDVVLWFHKFSKEGDVARVMMIAHLALIKAAYLYKSKCTCSNAMWWQFMWWGFNIKKKKVVPGVKNNHHFILTLISKKSKNRGSVSEW